MTHLARFVLFILDRKAKLTIPDRPSSKPNRTPPQQPIPQARRLQHLQRNPQHRLLLPRLHRLAPLQRRNPLVSRKSQGQDAPTGTPRMGTPKGLVRYSQECKQGPYRGEL